MDTVHISSGAVVHITEEGTVKVLLLYRNATDSWHLPKGTRQDEESLEKTALREIEEETGLEVQLEKYLGKLDSTISKDGTSISKETHYFLAHPIGGNPAVHDAEHDIVEFVPYPDALRHLERFSLYEKEGIMLKMAGRYLAIKP
jgi:8-oxo-dGTP pyrophosphatase MutT (NUDIX family)